MKFIIICLFLLNPLISRADFASGLIIGSLLSSRPTSTKIEIKDEFTKQVEQIEKTLPSQYEYVTQPNYQFSVVSKDAQKYVNYFKNGGYQVSYKSGILTFDLSSRYQDFLYAQKVRQQEQIEFNQKMDSVYPYVKKIGIVVLIFILAISFFQAIILMDKLGLLKFFSELVNKLIFKTIKSLDSKHKK